MAAVRHAGALEWLATYSRSAKPGRLLATLSLWVPKPVLELASALLDTILLLVLAVYYVLEAAVFELLPRR